MPHPVLSGVILYDRHCICYPILDHSFHHSLQENLLVSMMQVENTFFDLAEACQDRNVLVICDRGTMDASAFINRDQWDNIISRLGLDEVEIRDNRYNQVGSSSQ